MPVAHTEPIKKMGCLTGTPNTAVSRSDPQVSASFRERLPPQVARASAFPQFAEPAGAHHGTNRGRSQSPDAALRPRMP
jgi:hypothetical protein